MRFPARLWPSEGLGPRASSGPATARFRAQDVEALDCGHDFFNEIYQSLGLGWLGLRVALGGRSQGSSRKRSRKSSLCPSFSGPGQAPHIVTNICSCAVGDVESKRLKIFSSQPDRAPEAQPKRCCQGLLDEGTCTKDTSLADLIREAVCQCSHWSVFRSTER